MNKETTQDEKSPFTSSETGGSCQQKTSKQDRIITTKTKCAIGILLILLLIWLAIFFIKSDLPLPEPEQEYFTIENGFPTLEAPNKSPFHLQNMLDSEIEINQDSGPGPVAELEEEIPRTKTNDDGLRPLPPREKQPSKNEYFGYDLGKDTHALKSETLQGIFYDLKLNKELKPTKSDFYNVMTPFANGKWLKKYDENGGVHYPELDGFYASPTRLWNTFFLIDKKIEAKDAPAAFKCGKEVEQSSWVCIYSGLVEAPFSGKFRFLGFCDDALIVRFNNKIVLDHGWSTYTKSDKYCVGTYPTKCSDSTGLGQGLTIDVKKGQVYPVEIMFSEIPGGHFTLGVYFERLDTNGQPLVKNPKRFPLFRTTPDLPEKQPERLFPDFDPEGPIWKVSQ